MLPLLVCTMRRLLDSDVLPTNAMTAVPDALARLATEKRERSAVAADAAKLIRDARGYR